MLARRSTLTARSGDAAPGGRQAGNVATWHGKPTAADALIAVEIVSPHSVSDDQLVKRVRYARAGIEHYKIVRLAQNDGPAVSVEQLDAIDPIEVTMSWEQLDEWL
jgi:Uma2 family endonuclease